MNILDFHYYANVLTSERVIYLIYYNFYRGGVEDPSLKAIKIEL